MLQATRRRVGSAAWLALGLVVGLPSLAEAQLFPNRTIRRQRPDCAAESPFNAHVRRDYFGYYPTCWSRFPDGWACPCPNPELPDPIAEFRDRPRQDPNALPPAGPDDLGPDRDAGMDDAPGDRPGDPPADIQPPPRSGRQPFQLDPPGGGAAPRGNELPTPDPSVPPRAGTTAPAPPPGPKPGNAVGLLEMPAMPPAVDPVRSDLEPGRIAMAPDVTRTSNVVELPRDLGSLPPPAAPAVNPIGSMDEPAMAPMPAAPAQAPQRKTILGGLFGGNRRRR